MSNGIILMHGHLIYIGIVWAKVTQMQCIERCLMIEGSSMRLHTLHRSNAYCMWLLCAALHTDETRLHAVQLDLYWSKINGLPKDSNFKRPATANLCVRTELHFKSVCLMRASLCADTDGPT